MMPGAASGCPARLRPYPARRWLTWSDAFRARLRSCQRAPSPRRPCRGPGATCHRGAREGATGGGHRASGVTPPRLPVGGAKFVRAHPRVSHGSHGSALLTGWPRSRESAPLGVRRMQMTRHDHRQRSDRLGVRHASSADRRAGRGNVHETRIAVDFLSRPGKMVIRVDQMRMERYHDSQRSGRLAMTFGDVGDVRVVDRVAASIASFRHRTDRRRRRSTTFVARPTTAPRGVVTQVPTSAERWAFA